MASPHTDMPTASDGARQPASRDLASLIDAAELRVIERDAHARRRLNVIGDKIAALPRPRDLLLPASAAVSGVVALTWFVKRLGRGAARKRRAEGRPHGPYRDGEHRDRYRRAGLPWFQIIGLAWPLVPLSWRSRVQPTTSASALLAVSLPWFQSAFMGRRGDASAPVQAVAALDVARFCGTWFEVAHLPSLIEPSCDGQPATVYTLSSDSELKVEHRCVTPQGYRPVADGMAQVPPDSGGGKFRVSLFPEWWRWLPFAWSDEWVIAIDRDYQHALVGDPQRRQLRVLSRNPDIADAALDELLDVARQQGFELARLKVNTPV